MKALLRACLGLLGVAVVTTASFGYVWVSPVTKCPLPYAPDCCGPGFYWQHRCGMWYGPCYCVMPPCAPFGGLLPGKTGEALMRGGLPMTQDFKIAPIDSTLEALQGPQGPQLPQSPWANPLQGPQLPLGYGNMPSNYQRPYSVPPMMYQPQPMPQYAPMPGYQMQPMPQYAPMPGYQPQPMPQYAPMPGYMPYARPQGMSYQPVSRDPSTGIWQAQGTQPYGDAFRPIPSFNAPMPQPMPLPQGQPMAPYGYGPSAGPMPMMPPGNWGLSMQTGPGGQAPAINPSFPMQTPPLPAMPMTPGMPSTQPYMTYGPNNGFQYYLNGVDPSEKMSPIQGPQVPRMDMEPMQLPRMESFGPPPAARIGGPFPTHPFVRGPRDFFMWGTVMDEERARGSRPNPVP